MVAASGPAETGVREQPVNKGLEGVVVAETAISMVDGTAGRLTYRGHPIEELAEHHSFEEVLYLLWEGRLPDAQEHERFARELGAARVPSAGECAFLETLPRPACRWTRCAPLSRGWPPSMPAPRILSPRRCAGSACAWPA